MGEPEQIEQPKHVGAKLDAGADFLELGGLLEDVGAVAFPRERQRGSESADAAADNQDRLPVHLMLGLLLGLLLACAVAVGMAIIREYMDRTIYNARDLISVFRAPPLATIPYISN